MRYTTGLLYDNVRVDNVRVQAVQHPGDYGLLVRYHGSANQHGQVGGQNVFWNFESLQHNNTPGRVVVEAPAHAMNFSIGTKGLRQVGLDCSPYFITYEGPEGVFEPEHVGRNQVMDKHVRIRSLYLRQLIERVGPKALNNIVVQEQLVGNLWQQLSTWAGNGAPGWTPVP